MLNLYNTRTRTKEAFTPLRGKDVGLYTCGPTVYNYVHVGNLRTYVFEDILRRVLKHHEYRVNHVMNITDVGHLTDDADQGEDKMEKGSKREGKTAWEIAEFYTDAFKHDMQNLNILEPTVWCKATDHIDEQIDQVQALVDRGFAYTTSDGIYFDTTKIDDYGKLAQLEKQQLEAGARVDMGEKKNPHDFALWKFTKPGEKRQMEWEGFGKIGFPGWHIECSAMSMKYLGEQFDIHCGGIDHVPVHHTNEIAQAESATGKKPWVNVWMHGEFLLVDDPSTGAQGKMAKSGDNFLTLARLREEGIAPLDYRYFLLQAHYRKQLGFSWDALKAAAEGLKTLRQRVSKIFIKNGGDPKLSRAFFAAMDNDLHTPEALAILQSGLKNNQVSLEMITEFDKILGLDLLNHVEEVEIPEDVNVLLEKRRKAREEKDWAVSDRLRDEIEHLGFVVEDTGGEQKITLN